MGFMAAFGTGFFNQQNKDQANEQSQQDKLTQLSLANILKNIDGYNASKADYQKKVDQATSIATMSGGKLQAGDVVTMMNSGLNTQQILMQGLRQKSAPTTNAPSVNQQTDAAMGTTTPPAATPTAPGATPATPPATPGAAPANPVSAAASAATPDSSDTSIGSSNIQPSQVASAPAPQSNIPNIPQQHGGTIIDHIFGQPTTQDAYNKAQGQAAGVTGMSPDEISQARTGQYTPSADSLPTTQGFQIDPSTLVDWSKLDPKNYSSANLPKAIEALKQGDYATAAGLADNADAIQQRQLKTVYARAGAEANAQAQVDAAKDQTTVNELAGHIDPTTGQPFGKVKAQQIIDAQKYHSGMSTLTGGSDNFNPKGLDPQTLYASLPPTDKSWADSYLSGRTQWVPGSGKSGQEKSQEELKKLVALDPTFSPAVSKARYNAYQDLLSTKGNSTGAKLVSAATVINHMTDFAQSIKDVGNTHSLTYRNDVSNYFASHNSGSPLKNAENARDLTAEEMSKFLAEKSGGATDTDKARTSNMMPLNYGGVNPKTGVSNNQEIMDNLLHLMVGKLGPMADKLNDTFGTNMNAYDLLPQESIQKLRDLGYKVPDGTGQTTNQYGLAVPIPGHSIKPSNWNNPAGQGQAPSNIPQVHNNDDYNNVKAGQQYTAPDGKIYTKGVSQ